jgi:collagenase-like PrtC family protease
MSHIRAIRLDLNRNLTDAKLEIKESAIKLFMEHLDTLIEAEAVNSLILADTSAMSLSFAIFRPFNLSASAFAIAIKSCNS